MLARTETFFLGTTHPDRGVDTSHRGGPAGFIRVEDGALWWPDYPGNNMFNSFGNLAVDDTAAVLVPDFGTGTSLLLSGRATVEWVTAGSAGDDGGTGRRVRFTVQQVAGGPLPVHEEPTTPAAQPRERGPTGPRHAPRGDKVGLAAAVRAGAREVLDLLDAVAFVRAGGAEAVGVGGHGAPFTVHRQQHKQTGQ